MNLSNGQKWFLVITVGVSIMFFIITTALSMIPPSNTFTSPEEKRATQYTKCVYQASNNLYGDAEKQALSQCMQIFEQTNIQQ